MNIYTLTYLNMKFIKVIIIKFDFTSCLTQLAVLEQYLDSNIRVLPGDNNPAAGPQQHRGVPGGPG